MIAAAKEVYDEAMSWPDYPYTEEQMIEAMLRNAMRHYTPPVAAKPSRSSKDMDGFVYFMSDGEAIKIGKANDIKARLSGLQTSTHRPISVLGAVAGGYRKERLLHRMFADRRLRGEWFEDCAEIRDYVDANATAMH